jgi:hypothetical protein
MSFKRSRGQPESPQLPPMPSPVELMDYIDKISGTQTMTVIGADGKKKRVTERLPLTAQEQDLVDQAGNLINTSISNIMRLYEESPESVVDYEPFIQTFSQINDERMQDLSRIGNFQDIAQKVNAFRDISSKLALREFDSQSRMSEEILAKKGLQRSTASAEQRAAMATERSLASQQIDANAQNYGEDLMSRQLSREGAVFDFKERDRATRLQAAETEQNLAKQKEQELEQIRQNSLSENQNMLQIGQGIKAGETNKANLALQGNQAATNLYQVQAQDQNNRYNANVNRVMSQYKMDMENFRSRPPTFGQKIGDMATQAAGSWISAPGGGIDSGVKSFNSWNTDRRRGNSMNSLQQMGR